MPVGRTAGRLQAVQARLGRHVGANRPFVASVVVVQHRWEVEACVAPPRITDFVFDEENEAKLDWHGLDPERISQVIQDAEYVVVRNRKGRRASHLVIGRDRSGRCLAVPIEPTSHPTTWRPVTAWECKSTERALLRRRTR